jgi:hypothetical protein
MCAANTVISDPRLADSRLCPIRAAAGSTPLLHTNTHLDVVQVVLCVGQLLLHCLVVDLQVADLSPGGQLHEAQTTAHHEENHQCCLGYNPC